MFPITAATTLRPRSAAVLLAVALSATACAGGGSDATLDTAAAEAAALASDTTISPNVRQVVCTTYLDHLTDEVTLEVDTDRLGQIGELLEPTAPPAVDAALDRLATIAPDEIGDADVAAEWAEASATVTDHVESVCREQWRSGTQPAATNVDAGREFFDAVRLADFDAMSRVASDDVVARIRPLVPGRPAIRLESVDDAQVALTIDDRAAECILEGGLVVGCDLRNGDAEA